MTYIRKTKDEYILLANYGCGWEEETTEETLKDIKERLKEYRLNAPKFSYKWKKQRVKKTDHTHILQTGKVNII